MKTHFISHFLSKIKLITKFVKQKKADEKEIDELLIIIM